MWFELYQDTCSRTRDPWRWRLWHSSDAVVAVCAQGYPDEESCRTAILELRGVSPNTPIRTKRRARPR